MLGFLTDFIFGRFCAGNNCMWDRVYKCHTASKGQHFPTLLRILCLLHHFYALSHDASWALWWGKHLTQMTHLWMGTHRYLFSVLWTVNSVSAIHFHSIKNLLWQNLRATQIYQEKNKYLEDSSTTWSFSKTTSVGCHPPNPPLLAAVGLQSHGQDFGHISRNRHELFPGEQASDRAKGLVGYPINSLVTIAPLSTSFLWPEYFWD